MLKLTLPKPYFIVGEQVTGEVQYNINKSQNIRSISLKFTAYEHTEWQAKNETITVGESHVRTEAPLTHKRKRRTFINEEILLFPSITDSAQSLRIKKKGSDKLSPGTYSWHFCFVIPTDTPPSCFYKSGKVRIVYRIECIVNPKWSRNITTLQNLRVGLLFAIDPSIKPKIVEGQKSFLLAKSSLPISVKANLNKEVTFSGDQLLIYLDVENLSSKTIYGISAKIKQYVIFGDKKERITVANRKYSVSISENKKWSGNLVMEIPDLAVMPSCNGKLININYAISIHLKARAAKQLVIELPFVLSSFPPISMQLDQNQNPAVNSYLNTNWRSSIDSGVNPSLNIDIININDDSLSTSNSQPTPTAPLVATSVLETTVNNRASINSLSTSSSSSLDEKAATTTTTTLLVPITVTKGPLPLSSSSSTASDPIDSKDSNTSSSLHPQLSKVFYWKGNNNVPISPQIPESQEVDQAIQMINTSIEDINSAIWYCMVGELEEISDFGTHETFESCQSYLFGVSKSLLDEVSTICDAKEGSLSVDKENIKSLNIAELAKHISVLSQELGYHTKATGTFANDVTIQLLLITTAKTILLSSLQFLLVARNIRYITDDDQSLFSHLGNAAKGVFQGVEYLFDLIKKSVGLYVQSQQALGSAIATLKGFAFNFSNPFFEFPVSSFQDTRDFSIRLSSSLVKVVSVCNQSLDQTISELNNLSDTTCKYLTAVKGCLKQISDSKVQKEIYSFSFSLIDHLDKFMASTVRRPTKQHILSLSKSITQIINNIQSILGKHSISTRPPLPPKINYKLAITDLLTDLQNQTSKNLKMEGKVNDAEMLSAEISKDIVELVSIGVDNYQSLEGNVIFESDFAHEIIVSVQSLVSSAKRLYSFVQLDNDSIDISGEDRIEKIEKISSQVLTAAGKYLSALYTLASIETQDKLSDAAKMIAMHTSQLVTISKKAQSQLDKLAPSTLRGSQYGDLDTNSEDEEDEEEKVEETKPSLFASPAQSKIQQFEHQLKILRLEKELERARKELPQFSKKETNGSEK